MYFIQDLYKLILDFNKSFDFFYYSRVLRRLHVACTINVAFDAMQKLIIRHILKAKSNFTLCMYMGDSTVLPKNRGVQNKLLFFCC